MSGRSDRTIKPGASENVTATFSSKNLAGNFNKSISIMTNDPKHKRETLTCKGKVLVAFKASPRLANFRQVDADTTPMPQTVTITRGDGGPLDLKIAGTGKAGIETYLEEITPGEKYKLIISLSEAVQPGSLRSWVKLKTGIEQVPETNIPVYATIPGVPARQLSFPENS